MAENGNGGKRINFGDVVHLIEIATLFVSIGVTYQKFEQTMALVNTHAQSLDRIEHYLSTKDSKYWQIAKKVE